jgi:hypothetical protein
LPSLNHQLLQTKFNWLISPIPTMKRYEKVVIIESNNMKRSTSSWANLYSSDSKAEAGEARKCHTRRGWHEWSCSCCCTCQGTANAEPAANIIVMTHCGALTWTPSSICCRF